MQKTLFLVFVFIIVSALTCIQTEDTSTDSTDTAPADTTEAAPDPNAEVMAIPSLADVLAIPSSYNENAAVPSFLKRASEGSVDSGAVQFLRLPKMFVGLSDQMSTQLLSGLFENLGPLFDAVLPDNLIPPGKKVLVEITDGDGPNYVSFAYNESTAAFMYNIILYWDNAAGEHCPAIDFSFKLSDSDVLTTAQVSVYPTFGPAEDGDGSPGKVFVEHRFSWN